MASKKLDYEDPPPADSPGGRILAEMREQRMRQAKLAELAGVDPSWLSRVISNKRRAGAKGLNQICSALGIMSGWVLTGQEPRYAPKGFTTKAWVDDVWEEYDWPDNITGDEIREVRALYLAEGPQTLPRKGRTNCLLGLLFRGRA